MSVGYAKLIDKARKLKALADRGNAGERDTAERFYLDFLKKNNITEKEVDTERFKRVFKLLDSEYEVFVSYIITSINPFCLINKTDKGEYVVSLDDEDFIECEHKFSVFHSAFKKDEKRLLSVYKRYEKKQYEKEKLVFLTAFLTFHKDYFTPDEYALKKARNEENKNLHPDMANKVKDVSSDEKLQDKIKKAEEDYKKNKHKYDNQPEPVAFNQDDVFKIQEYSNMLTKVFYVRANKTLLEKN